MEAKFLGCVVDTHWLPHILVQIFFGLILVHKNVWCLLCSLSIQIRVLAMTFCITLSFLLYKKRFQIELLPSKKKFGCLGQTKAFFHVKHIHIFFIR